MLLLDNLDMLFLEKSTKEWTCSCLSGFLDTISRSGYQICIIATCSNADHIPPSFTQPYRLGEPIHLPLPSTTYRHSIISSSIRQGRVFSSMSFEPLTQEATECLEIVLVDRSTGFSFRRLENMFRKASLESLTRCFTQNIPIQRDIDNEVYFDSILTECSIEAKLPILDAVSSFVVNFKSEPDFVGQDPLLVYLMEALQSCSGILIEGPSGSGKTALAHALGYSFKSSHTFLSISCADLVHKVRFESSRQRLLTGSNPDGGRIGAIDISVVFIRLFTKF